MRVALITRDYPPIVSGIATHVASLADALRKLGVEADVFTGHGDFGTLTIPLRRRLGGYDIVHVQSGPYGAFVSGARLVVTVHSPVSTERKHYTWLLQLKSIPALYLEKRTIGKAGAILAVSEATKDDLVRGYGLSPERIEVIGNGVAYERFALPREERPTTDRIFMVARLEPRKNMAEAVRALGGLGLGYQARIAGMGSQRRMLERVARDVGASATFLGEVSNETLPSLYLSSDIFLTTSRSEGFGLTVLEAMASGCAVAASDIPTHRAIITDGVDGLIYHDLEDLRAKLRMLISTPERTLELGRRARETAKRYSWDAVARRVLAAYEAVARARPSPPPG